MSILIPKATFGQIEVKNNADFSELTNLKKNNISADVNSIRLFYASFIVLLDFAYFEMSIHNVVRKLNTKSVF